MAYSENNPLRVLVVEDEPVIALLVEEYVTDLGWTCVGICQNSAEAIEAINDQGCDLVLIDAKLGEELATPVASLLDEKGILYISMSGYDIVPEGFSPLTHLPKPFTEEAFQSAMRRVVDLIRTSKSNP